MISRFLTLSLLVCAAFTAYTSVVYAQQTANPPSLRLTISDVSGQPVSGATCILRSSKNPKTAIETVVTDEQGTAVFKTRTLGNYVVHIERAGFNPFDKSDVAIKDNESADIKIALTISSVEASIDVTTESESSTKVEAGASTPTGNLKRDVIEKVPLQSSNVTDALPLIPGVVRSTTGEISIKGASEQQSVLLVNGLNASDPATGNFRLNLPIDSVEAVQVFQHPYTAQYGGFIGGVTRVDTRRGGEQWHVELNDFLPDPRIKDGKIVGIAEDAPHLNFNGPIIKNRLYLSQSASYNIAKTPVRGLVFPFNETKTESVSTYTQLDYILSPTHTETYSFGHFPEKVRYVGLDFFQPQPVTPNYKQKDYFFTIRDNQSIFGGILESALSTKSFTANINGQGSADQILTPTVQGGNYFATQDRESHRVELLSYFTRPSQNLWVGSHEFKFGFDFNRINNQMDYTANPVNILRADGTLAERITFDNTTPFKTANSELVGFVQDRWLIRPNLSVDIGLRYEDQRIADELNVAPRAGFAWSPRKGDKTVIRGGIGVFYDKVPLNIRSFNRLPGRLVTDFDIDGTTVLIRHHFRNVLVDTVPIEPLDFRRSNPDAGFVPQNVTWSIEADHTVNSWMQLRASYTHSYTNNIYIVDPELDFRGKTAIVLRSAGEATYHAFELTAKFNLSRNNLLYASYVHSRARGDLNDFNSFYGDFGAPVVRPNQYSNLPFDVPNRLVAWGSFSLPMRINVSPIVELRNGFPYSVHDQLQNFVGVRNADSTRFPKFFAVDAEISKDFQLTKKYAVRLSLRGFNLTDHFNPRNVRLNTSDPLFGQFFASYHRYFTGGFDILF